MLFLKLAFFHFINYTSECKYFLFNFQNYFRLTDIQNGIAVYTTGSEIKSDMFIITVINFLYRMFDITVLPSQEK